MKGSRPGILAVRAVNQYRRREVLTYLGLRYYLDNSAARSDEWVRRVASDLVRTRTDSPYFRVHHYKDVDDRGVIHHRSMTLPGANEALAEAAILSECANHPREFANPECVFSYSLTRGDDRTGVFEHYVSGLRARHGAIAKACDACPGGVVSYLDIRRFYPSISTDLAERAWGRQADSARLPSNYRELAERLIGDHAAAARQQDENGILTGPMFSHLLANLVLRELDQHFAITLPGGYFRYVDDITLVGDKTAVAYSRKAIRDRLQDLGLELHDERSPKSIEVSVSDWLKGRNDFQESRRKYSWMSLIGDLKRYLLAKPEERGHLQEIFRDEGIRIPILDYSSAAFERGYLTRLRELAERPWFKRKSQTVSLSSLVNQAKWLRKSYEQEFGVLLETGARASGFERKRFLPKLRYRAGRLVYLAKEDALSSLADGAREIRELHFHTEVMKAVSTSNLDQLLPLGTNAAQAAAQPLRAAGSVCKTAVGTADEAIMQSLAVFLFNGVRVERHGASAEQASELIRFATSGSDMALMKSRDPFVREMACLHGISEQPRHPELLESAFDEDEQLAMDAIEQLQQSVSL